VDCRVLRDPRATICRSPSPRCVLARRGQDADGAWRKHLSTVARSPLQTYNTRTAWALAQAGIVFEEVAWVDAARRNLDWALGQQDASGWFANIP